MILNEWYLYNQFCTTLVTTIFSSFYWTKTIERERRRERIKTHVSMRDSCFKSCQKIDVQISFLINLFAF